MGGGSPNVVVGMVQKSKIMTAGSEKRERKVEGSRGSSGLDDYQCELALGRVSHGEILKEG